MRNCRVQSVMVCFCLCQDGWEVGTEGCKSLESEEARGALSLCGPSFRQEQLARSGRPLCCLRSAAKLTAHVTGVHYQSCHAYAEGLIRNTYAVYETIS